MTLWREVVAVAGAIVAAAAWAAEPNIEFSGVLTTGGQTLLALTEKTTNSTRWVDAGDEFAGYQISRYDPTEDAVFLKKDGQEIRLGLVSPKSALDARGTVGANAGAAPSQVAAAPSTQAAVNAIRGNLRTLASAARQYQAQRGVTNVSYADLVGPGKFIAEIKPVAGENYSTLNFSPNASAVSVTMADGAIVTLDLSPASQGAGLRAAGFASSTPYATPAPPTAAPVVPPPEPPPPAPIGSEVLTPTGRDTSAPNYTLQPGDNWEKISTSTGVPVDQLKRLNPLIKGDSLPAGQAIRIR